MRTRLTLLFVAIVLMAGFAALNWSEFAHPAQLSWGWGSAESGGFSSQYVSYAYPAGASVLPINNVVVVVR